MFATFISIVLSIAINLFGGAYSVSLDTCKNVYFDTASDCMASIMQDSATGKEYTIPDYCAGRAAKALVMRCRDCGEVVYIVTFTEFIH